MVLRCAKFESIDDSRFDCLDESHCFSRLFRLKANQQMGERYCNKCRVSRPAEGNAWCLGCLSWETLERELTGSWSGPTGLRVIADNLVLGAAREVRALRALGAGLSQAPSASAGNLPGGTRATEVKQELVGATAKRKPGGEEGSEEYEYEESEEEEPCERDRLAKPVVPAVADERPELPRRSRVPEPTGARRAEGSERTEERTAERRSRSQRQGREIKEKRKDKVAERKRDRREVADRDEGRRDRRQDRTDGKKKKKRGGRKHKRLSRLEADPYRAIHRSLDKGVLDKRERLERSPLP